MKAQQLTYCEIKQYRVIKKNKATKTPVVTLTPQHRLKRENTHRDGLKPPLLGHCESVNANNGGEKGY